MSPYFLGDSVPKTRRLNNGNNSGKSDLAYLRKRGVNKPDDTLSCRITTVRRACVYFMLNSKRRD